MALYSYQAYTKEGKYVSGQLDASSLQAVKEQLVRQGLFPVKVEQTAEHARGTFTDLFQARITIKDKILFTKQLTILLKSGVPLLQALELLIDQMTGRMRSMIVSIKDGIKEGSSFAQELSRYPSIFDTIYIQLVRAGEVSGKLELILERLTDYLERKDEMNRRVKSALSYPLFQLAFSLLAVCGLLIFVVPSLADNLLKMGQELPGPTQFIMSVSDFFVNHYIKLIIVMSALTLGMRSWVKTKAGKHRVDTIKLRLPIVSYFSQIGAVVQFCQTLGLLMESGVHLSESLDIVVKIIDNSILADALRQARDKIIKQGKITQYLQQTHVFPPIAIYLIKTGEQSGELGHMLLVVAENYEKDLKERADSLASKIGPIMLVVMGLIVGFIILSIMLPMLQMGDVNIEG